MNLILILLLCLPFLLVPTLLILRFRPRLSLPKFGKKDETKKEKGKEKETKKAKHDDDHGEKKDHDDKKGHHDTQGGHDSHHGHHEPWWKSLMTGIIYLLIIVVLFLVCTYLFFNSRYPNSTTIPARAAGGASTTETLTIESILPPKDQVVPQEPERTSFTTSSNGDWYTIEGSALAGYAKGTIHFCLFNDPAHPDVCDPNILPEAGGYEMQWRDRYGTWQPLTHKLSCQCAFRLKSTDGTNKKMAFWFG